MIDGKQCIAIIFARGGSKGLPRKNIRKLNGVPLIGYSIRIAKQIEVIDHVIVSTDDLEISDVAKNLGAEVPFIRPKYLAEDDTPEIDCWKHAIRFFEKDVRYCNMKYILSLPPTSPLRAKEDVEKAISCLINEKPDLVVGISESDKNPYFNMVKIDQNGYISLVCKAPKKFIRRQDAPKVHNITTIVYATTVDYVLRSDNLYDGNVKGVIVPRERALDIDNRIDFAFAEFLHIMDNRPQSEN